MNRTDTAGLAARKHDDFVSDLEHTTGDTSGVASVVAVLDGLGPDHVLDGEADVDQIAVAGDVDLLEVSQQRRSLLPGGALGFVDDVVALQR